MKNITYSLFVIVQILLAGCINNTTVETYSTDETLLHTGEVTLVASIENYAVKADIDDLGKGLWKAGDEIAVYCTNGSFIKFTLSGTGDTKRAFFKGEIPSGYELGSVAVYPYSAAMDFSNGILRVNTPTEYANDASFPCTMVATIENSREITFKQLFGYVNLKLTNVPTEATSVKVSADSSQLGGIFNYDISSIGSQGIIPTSSYQGIQYDFAETGSKQTVEIQMPIKNYDNVRVTLYDANKKELTSQRINTSSVEVNRATMMNFEYNIVNAIPVIEDCITICGVKWALGNLLYQSGSSAKGFREGWKIADSQWFYYHYNQAEAYNSNSKAYNGTNLRTDVAQEASGFDHFNFGGISDSFTFNATSCAAPSVLPFDIAGMMFTDQGCIAQTKDYESAKFGDLAYWASNGKYRLPTSSELKTLAENASVSFGYIKTGEIVNGIDLKVWGMLFTNNDGTKVTDLTEKEFSNEDLKSGLFLPLAGRRADASSTQIISTRMEGEYWSSMAQDKASDATSAAWKSNYTYSTLLKIQYTGVITYGFTVGERYDRQSGFSIRPVLR